MVVVIFMVAFGGGRTPFRLWRDRKSTRLNSIHSQISYAVFCLKKKKIQTLFLLVSVHPDYIVYIYVNHLDHYSNDLSLGVAIFGAYHTHLPPTRDLYQMMHLRS